MRKCPSCGEETIPLKWMLFEKANGQKGRCYVCNHCGEKIRKKNYLGYILDFNIETIILVTLGLYFLMHSFLLSIFFLFFTIIASNIFASLQVTDESYCRGDMTKIGAFFGLIAMAGIITYMVYFFIIQPFFR